MTMRIIDLAFQRVDELDPERLARSRKSEATMVVTSDAPAIEVAARATKMNVALILVTPKHCDEVVGLVEPDWIIHKIRLESGKRLGDFVEAVEHLSARPRLPGDGLDLEWLSLERPELIWCSRGGHYVHNLPCRSHQGPATKGRSGVASGDN